VIRIDNWRVDVDGTDFDAPEVRRSCLRGVVVGHPLVPDGTTVMTSPIVMMTGERAATERGRVYELGVMETGYARFLQGQAARGQRLVLGVPIEDLLQRAPTLAALDDRAAAFGESEGA
jgi:hypothetical protein